ncbi:cytochrome c biogenesis ATP-binding export protein ccmA [Striga asiatica]|uniref:Cytochrome c biogenesis ATP-binding export protein ccmA n=1 Tax=Striga asiatica TaxID=4170 RepID=A0A5A7PVS3_STRAF|nr:cytochrome c biogenesis ATP-binding export protein ccmA [Striga asiatica]
MVGHGPHLPRILLSDVSCMRNAQQILRHVNASIHDGGALVLSGTNGSGKSTFLRMLAGFSRPSAGRILWDGHDITDSGVFHQYKLQLNWLSLKDAIKEKFTVLDNVQWFEILEGKQGRSMAAIELMGLGRLAKEKARMLSMGQRKRLQLARLLAIDRPIWLLDEPSVALDDEGVRLLEFVIREHRKKGGIVIVATHLPIEMEDAMILRLPPRFPRRMTLELVIVRVKIWAFGLSGTHFSLNPATNMINCVEDSGFVLSSSDDPPDRAFVKVYKSGSFGRSLDINKFNSYNELRMELRKMQKLGPELLNNVPLLSHQESRNMNAGIISVGILDF